MAKSKVNEEAYRVAPYKIWIAHTDNTVNGVNVVHKWHRPSGRLASFRAAQRVIDNYKGNTIREIIFYAKLEPGKPKVGGRDEYGRYYGLMDFMNKAY